VATYFIKPDGRRTATVERFARQHGRALVISHIVLLECANVFPWTAGRRSPPEWERLQSDLGRRFLVDTMQWDMLRQRATDMLRRI
jgi:hypothetical protein